ELYDVRYLNPISNGSLKKYKFQLKDTLYQAKDSVFVIAFEPFPNKNFQGLKGTLYVNSNRYAVQNVIASPAEKGKINISIQQQYVFLNNEYWFPEQLNYELIFEGTEKDGDELVVEGKSYIDRVEFGLEVERTDFPLRSIYMAENAGKKELSFWKNYRPNSLDSVDLKTYHIVDSLGQKYHFDRYLNVLSGIFNYRIPIGFVDLDLSKTFIYNNYEGFRLGTGFYTNEKLFKKISFGGFFGYGLKDKEWKYGGEIIYKPTNRFSISGGYENDLVETGKNNENLENIFNPRRYIASRFDNTKHYFIELNFLPFRYVSTNITFDRSKTIPKYNYEFLKNETVYTSYYNSTVNLGIRYAYGEKMVDVLGGITKWENQKYPVLSFSYTRGIKGFFESDFDYNKFEVGIEQTFHSRGLGISHYKLEGGLVDNPVPYGLLFTGKGSFDDDFPVIIKDHFQTMFLYEFLSNQKLNLFLSHDFGTLLFKTEKFQPKIILHQNIGWGNLSHPENHKFVNFKTMEEIYMESGLQFDNLLKINYLDIGYLGFGVAGFYRYGFYSLPEFEDNFSLKATIGFTIK
ncbi:MAG TPA: DUF5686 family protein, partial [Flavobacteriaceae bacterium]|nr:DUF5686 family protein [Flavobacteriaceae bacterium]